VNIYRRLYGVGSYSLFETLEISGTTDSLGNLDLGLFDVPNEEGYESYAAAGVCP